MSRHRVVWELGTFGGSVGFMRAVCSCGSYQSSWGTPASSYKAWRNHRDSHAEVDQ